MSPDQVIEFSEAMALLPLKSLFATVVAGIMALFMTAQTKAHMKRYIGWRRALKRKAIEGDWIMLRDQHMWEVRDIEYRETQLRRQEDVSTNGRMQTRTYTKYLSTEEYSTMEITKVYTDGSRR